MSGKVAGQLQGFTEDAQFAGQDYDTNLSFSIEPEFYWEWNDGEDSIIFEPFIATTSRTASGPMAISAN
ncbi:hypothetical protein [Aliamphritea spongicola]|nr:hypothetical protein [Aliamphritea spongicola]